MLQISQANLDEVLRLLEIGKADAEWDLQHGGDNLSGKAYKRHQDYAKSLVNDYNKLIAALKESDKPHVEGAGQFS